MKSRRVLIVIAFLALIHNVLRVVASILGTPWGMFNYLTPVRTTPVDLAILMEIFGLSAVVAFAAVVATSVWRETRPVSPMWSSALCAAGAGAAVGLVSVYVSATGHVYGWVMFVSVPVTVGFVAVLVQAHHRPLDLGDALVVSMSSIVLLGGALAAFALEGMVCLAMALPIAIPLALIGGALGYTSQRMLSMYGPMMFLVLAGVIPFGSSVEQALHSPADTFVVTTSIDLPVSSERVWNTVLEPATLESPRQLLFRAGIAYPLASHMEGAGLGATRYCDFSTGKLVEPVLVWNEYRQLRFRVASNPLPMQEWTPYAQIHPPHLDGFLTSQQGEFQLETLAGGGTRLHATTWYQHRLWPAQYWRWWSDYIIHQVHEMVLENIRARSLQPAIQPEN